MHIYLDRFVQPPAASDPRLLSHKFFIDFFFIIFFSTFFTFAMDLSEIASAFSRPAAFRFYKTNYFGRSKRSRIHG
jgi:hypothetical protein